MSSYGRADFVDNAGGQRAGYVKKTQAARTSGAQPPATAGTMLISLADHLRRCSTNSPTVNPASLIMASIRLRLSSLTCRGTGTGLGSPSLHITVWLLPP